MYYVFTFCHSSASTLRSTAIKPSFCKNSIIRDGSNLKKLGKSKHLQCFHWGNICSFWYWPIGTYQKQTMSLQMNSLERNYTGCKTFTICQTDWLSLLSARGQFLSKITCMKSSLHCKYIQCNFYTFYKCPIFHCNPTVLFTFNYCSKYSGKM